MVLILSFRVLGCFPLNFDLYDIVIDPRSDDFILPLEVLLLDDIFLSRSSSCSFNILARKWVLHCD